MHQNENGLYALPSSHTLYRYEIEANSVIFQPNSAALYTTFPVCRPRGAMKYLFVAAAARVKHRAFARRCVGRAAWNLPGRMRPAMTAMMKIIDDWSPRLLLLLLLLLLQWRYKWCLSRITTFQPATIRLCRHGLALGNAVGCLCIVRAEFPNVCPILRHSE